jgi:hypothetical protein
VAVEFAVSKAPVGPGLNDGTCPAEKPGLVVQFQSLEYDEERGFVCGAGGGATSAPDGAIVTQAQTDDTVKVDLTNRAQSFAPAICGAGLNLGLFGACGDASVFSADAGAGPHGLLEDIIGLTCSLQ